MPIFVNGSVKEFGMRTGRRIRRAVIDTCSPRVVCAGIRPGLRELDEMTGCLEPAVSCSPFRFKRQFNQAPAAWAGRREAPDRSACLSGSGGVAVTAGTWRFS